MTEEHRGVGIVIRDVEGDLFYLQQKCDHYPIEEYRGFHSFFGGAIENGEGEREALKRELGEELSGKFALIIFENLKKIGDYTLEGYYGQYQFAFYEAVVQRETIENFARLPAWEGFGVLVNRKDVKSLNFVHGLKIVLEDYLK